MARYRGTHYVPGMSEAQARRAEQLEIPVLVAVLATIPVLILISMDLDGPLGTVAEALNWAVWLTFLVEAVIMFRISPDDVAYVKRNRLDLAILVLTPPFLPEVLHFLWVLRLLRILDLMPVLGRIFEFNGFRYAATLVFICVFGGGIAYAEIEEGRGVDEFDGVWWAMTTITTVGYGDQFPESPGGRVLGMALMLMGPVVIGLVASGVGSMVTKTIQRDLSEVDEEVEEQLEDEFAEAGVRDRLILERLDEIVRRLDALEGRAGTPPG